MTEMIGGCDDDINCVRMRTAVLCAAQSPARSQDNKDQTPLLVVIENRGSGGVLGVDPGKIAELRGYFASQILRGDAAEIERDDRHA